MSGKKYHWWGKELTEAQMHGTIEKLEKRKKRYFDDFNTFGYLGMESDIRRANAVLAGDNNAARFTEEVEALSEVKS